MSSHAFPQEPSLDVASAVERVRSRALVLVVFALVGLAGGYLVFRGEERGYVARTVLFVTQTGGLAQPGALAAIARSQALQEEAARRAGISPAKLAADLSTTQVGTRVAGQALSFQIALRAPQRRAALSASRFLASAVLDRIGRFQTGQVASSRLNLADARRDLAAAKAREAFARSLTDPTTRATALGLIQQRKTSALTRINAAESELALAEAQRSQIVSSSVTPTGARTATTSALVGAALGLIVATLLSLARPRRPAAPTGEEGT